MAGRPRSDAVPGADPRADRAIRRRAPPPSGPACATRAPRAPRGDPRRPRPRRRDAGPRQRGRRDRRRGGGSSASTITAAQRGASARTSPPTSLSSSTDTTANGTDARRRRRRAMRPAHASRQGCARRRSRCRGDPANDLQPSRHPHGRGDARGLPVRQAGVRETVARRRARRPGCPAGTGRPRRCTDPGRRRHRPRCGTHRDRRQRESRGRGTTRTGGVPP